LAIILGFVKSSQSKLAATNWDDPGEELRFQSELLFIIFISYPFGCQRVRKDAIQKAIHEINIFLDVLCGL
jgi:hypothetical protein